jgi:hypothetical protein
MIVTESKAKHRGENVAIEKMGRAPGCAAIALIGIFENEL